MFGQCFIFGGGVLCFLTFLLAVGGVRLFHREEGRSKVFVVQGTEVVHLGGELGEIVVSEGVLGSYALSVIVG